MLEALKAEFRYAVKHDVERLVEIERGCFSPSIYQNYILEEYDFQESIHDPDSILIVAHNGDDLMGYCLLNPRDRNHNIVNVESVAIDERYRGLKLGRAIMECAEFWSMSNEFNGMSLQVHADNKPALHLYKRMNYTETFRRPNFYADGGTLIGMQKSF